ncbi:hypothetical protein AusDCA_0369 [Desulfitobacterium sp. AusDCA]
MTCKERAGKLTAAKAGETICRAKNKAKGRK